MKNNNSQQKRTKDSGTSFDEILHVVGPFGRYQKTVLLMFLLTAVIPSGFLSLSSVFLSATPNDFWCRAPNSENSTVSQFYEPYRPRKKSCQLCVSRKENLSDHEFLGNSSACNVSNFDFDSCRFGVEFNREIFKETSITEWELVCDRKFQGTLTFTLFKAGGIVGPLIFGFLADRFGRKRGFYFCAAFKGIFELATGFVPSYTWFCICRFCVGMTTHSTYLLPYIVCLEIIGPKYRASVSVYFSLFYTMGCLIYVGMSYSIRYWRYLNLVTALICVALYVVLFFFFPESPRWLLSQYRHDELANFLKKMAKRNGLELSPDFAESLPEVLNNTHDEDKAHNTSTSVMDLFRTSNLRKKTVILVLLNCCNKGVSIGTNYYAPLFSPNPHLSSFLNSVVELPPYFFAKSAFDKFGRRTSLFFGFFFGAIFFLSAFVTAKIYAGDTQASSIYYVILFATLLAKFCITITYLCGKLFEDELFPTVVRANGHALVSFLSAVMTCGVPFIVDLGHIYEVLPLSVFGSMCLVSSVSVFFLPETAHQPLPQTLEEGEEFGKHDNWKDKIRLVQRRPVKPDHGEMDLFSS